MYFIICTTHRNMELVLFYFIVHITSFPSLAFLLNGDHAQGNRSSQNFNVYERLEALEKALESEIKERKSDTLQKFNAVETQVRRSLMTINDIDNYVRNEIQNITNEIAIPTPTGNTKTVAFTVALKSTTYQSEGSLLLPGHIFTNIGGGYNATTGKFTCPVKGLYAFHVHLVLEQSGNGIWIYKNNIKTTPAYSETTQYNFASTSLVTLLDVGDVVTIKSVHSKLKVHEDSAFSGMKIN